MHATKNLSTSVGFSIPNPTTDQNEKTAAYCEMFTKRFPVLFPGKNITRKMHVLSFVAPHQIRTQNLVYKMLKIEQMGEYVHCQINELSRQFASINNTEKRDDILENFGHEMFSHAVP